MPPAPDQGRPGGWHRANPEAARCKLELARSVDEWLARFEPGLLEQPPPPEPVKASEVDPVPGWRGMRDVPWTACLLDRDQAEDAAELAERIGIGRAAARVGVHRRTLRLTWDRYGIDVEPPGAGRRRRSA